MGRKGTKESDATRATIETARARVAELEAAVQNAATEYESIGKTLPTAGAAEVARLSARRGELERLHRDLGIAADAARRDRDAAEEAHALARLPELLSEREEATSILDAAIQEALPDLRALASEVATRTAEVGSLRFPTGRGRRPEPHLLTAEGVLRDAVTRALYGGAEDAVQIEFTSDYYATRPPEPLVRRHYTSGTRMAVPPGTAEVLQAEGVVRIVTPTVAA
jgi:hypothetical protein